MRNFDRYCDEIAYTNYKDCKIHHLRVGNESCDGENCIDCFIQNFKWLNEEFKEPIKLTKVQYEILKKLKDKNAKTVQMLKNKILIHKDNLDYFLSVLGIETIEIDYDYEQLEIEDILNNCEVVE